MIYIVGIALVATFAGCYFRIRSQGFGGTLVDFLVSAAAGWTAGIMIGIGARIGMWSIPFFNGVESTLTLDGSLQVVLVFSLFGIALGVIYEFLFREIFRHRGIVFGSLVTLVTAYPLTIAALQQITFTPAILPTMTLSVLFVGLMFIPFSVLLELILSWYHRMRELKRPLLSQLEQ